jgi:Squalene-hopene cyclase C-terminal domain
MQIQMKKWWDEFNYDPKAPLLDSGDKSIALFSKHDLLDKEVALQDLWQLSIPQGILRKQRPNGSWVYPGAKDHVRTQENYNQMETYRSLGILIEEFGFDRKHPAIQQAAEYLFTFQTREGDFRGIYGIQYSTNYSAGITELLIKGGFGSDPRIKSVFNWLISIRQSDGGWAIPFRTKNYNIQVISNHPKTIEPDTSKPFSHMITGVVLRAFSADPLYRKSKEAKQAGKLLLANLFNKDNYPDRQGADYWLRFTFPFWYTDLISALDSLSLLKFAKEESQIDKALKWFITHQERNGLWNLNISKGQNKDVLRLWLALAICRIFKRFSKY